ncbi:twin arginine-targeting protein translocase TatB [Acidithiobacillus marinus]|uniref:Sec-independent protein translocase protein TatB n=1 Tax=Acidithiobacillus marinus TaxID=187490 RepID=A0A2I1DQS4_9PROT|nr:Sec-independent protein translocase protein TatB [Acidithiobacillus marinus]PKY12218.1 twin arginine-targeting protein translocase TatB [Acidithiobacillus marinus]
MFDFSFGELALLGIIVLLVVGPEKMPEMARTAGKWYGVMRRTMTGLRSEVEQQLLLDELRKEADNLRDYANEELLPGDITASSTLRASSENAPVSATVSPPESHVGRQAELDIDTFPPSIHAEDRPGPEDRLH